MLSYVQFWVPISSFGHRDLTFKVLVNFSHWWHHSIQLWFLKQFWWISLWFFFLLFLHVWPIWRRENPINDLRIKGLSIKMMNLWLTSEILPLLSVLFYWLLWPLAHTFHLTSVASQDHASQRKFVVVKCNQWKGKWKGNMPFQPTMQHCHHVHFTFDT